MINMLSYKADGLLKPYSGRHYNERQLSKMLEKQKVFLDQIVAKSELDTVKAANYNSFEENRIKLNKTQAENNHALIG